ncbi:TrkH family potassium uptake protein [Schumannella sp. 10F1B-5-1]|uniref:TrkH family potassium uptake protein n=1 Tax=Schumannella sp. 10F1B-5-1 TaxID=2590780 RepID=UPI001131AAFD|nr:potassium transporter TrkG [Schumannella sp. 10F1B-5-1]TPW71070.1 TrkH family potassium uptake protein [Schumannella sp. 10F1B-5-1]
MTGTRPRRRLHPARAIFGGFGAAAVIGTGLLMLPISARGPGGASWSDALFTAVSALCVTGHVVVDTPTFWTPFGQVVILLLVQLGGFGVMTFATFVGVLVVRRLSFSARLNAAAETRSLGLGDMRRLVVNVIRISLGIELVAAIILTARFALAYDQPLPEAIWLGVFHGVSSFNNAGFALFSDSMMGFVGDPVISLTICGAVILGGLGFPVLVQLAREFRHPRLWSMNTRLVLAFSAVLTVLGWVGITALEWSNPATLGGLDPASRVLAGFFQSVQTRTAGFNSVDTGELTGATLLGMDVLMFIGGGPAGTAGGIKVTTFGVLLFILIAEVRGDGVVNVFGKRLSRAVHRQAIAVVLVSVALVVVATIAIMVMSGVELSKVLFETISAFSTVGLSTGITADLPIGAQLVLAALMFIGRLGPITFATALALRRRQVHYQLPKERPIIG